MSAPNDSATNPWPPFLVCAISFFVVMFDLAVVNVAFPDILTDFGIERADGSWIVSLHNILFGSLLVVAGKAADSVGRRRILRSGIDAHSDGYLLVGAAMLMAAIASIWQTGKPAAR